MCVFHRCVTFQELLAQLTRTFHWQEDLLLAGRQAAVQRQPSPEPQLVKCFHFY